MYPRLSQDIYIYILLEAIRMMKSMTMTSMTEEDSEDKNSAEGSEKYSDAEIDTTFSPL